MPGIGRPFPPGKHDPRRGHGPLKGLAAYLREQTDGGLEIADLFLSIARGEAQPLPTAVTVNGTVYDVELNGQHALIPDMDQRMIAARWLADRYFGKAPDKVELTGGDGESLFDPRKLPDAALLGLAEIVRAIAERPETSRTAGEGHDGGDPTSELH